MTDIESLIFYLITFGVSSIGIMLYEHQRKCQWRNVVLIFSIGIPVLIAAFRMDVGTDFNNYNWVIEWELNHSFSEVINGNRAYEIGFRVLVKILGIFNHPVFVWGGLTFISIMLPFYTLKTQYKEISISTAYIVYLHMFFPQCLNLTRQYIAVAIMFWGMKYIYESKFCKWLAVIAVSMLFHKSAVIGIVLYLFWNHKKNKAIKPEMAGLVIAAAAAGVIIWRPLLQTLINIVPMLSKYSYLLMQNYGKNRDIFVKILILLAMLIFKRYFKNKDERMVLFIYALFFSVIIGFTGYYTTFLKRISLYYDIFIIVLFGCMPSFSKNADRGIMKAGIYLCMIIYFVFTFYVLKQGDIIPYHWRIN